MIAVKKDVHYVDGERCVRADILTTTTPDQIPSLGDEIIGLDAGDYLWAGSTLWCADTGIKWVMFEFGVWVDSTDTTTTFTPESGDGGGGGK